MIYGSNILSSVVANWQVTGGTVTQSAITLEAGGYAVQNIDLSVLPTMPEYMLLSVIANPYSDPYAMSLMAELKVISESGVVRIYDVPIVDTGSGVCLVSFPVESIKHASLTFTFRTTSPVIISDYSLFPPKLSEVDLTEVMDRLPRLLNDYNRYLVNVGTGEDIVALISAYVTETTELTGKFTLSYVASEDTEVIIRIKDNEISELYTPMTFSLAAGRGTIGIPHGYLIKSQGYHNFTVTAQVTNGNLTVDARQIMYIIDGGRIAYSVMDIGAVAYDISVCKLSAETQISYAYAICIDEGLCSVKRAELTETPGAAWVTIANIGPAIDAAIEFDGEWAFNKFPYVFNTEEVPWISWVDPDGTLYAKQLHSEEVAVELATGVSHISMVRGWNNTLTPGQDHGLIFVYVKSGSIYYRAWATQINGLKAWEIERAFELFTGIAVEANAFRTNDYRVGINVLDDAGITHTFLTPRNWSGIGVEQHLITVTAKAEVAFTEVTYHKVLEEEIVTVSTNAGVALLFAATDNTITSIENLPVTKTDEFGQEYQDWGFLVRVTLDYFAVNIPTIILVDTQYNSSIPVESIEEVSGSGGFQFDVYVDDVAIEFGLNTVQQTVQVTVSGAVNEAGYTHDTMVEEFTPVNLVFPDLPLPEVEAIWNE
jgi:hypothetical protein